jgi:hypothetical protein
LEGGAVGRQEERPQQLTSSAYGKHPGLTPRPHFLTSDQHPKFNVSSLLAYTRLCATFYRVRGSCLPRARDVRILTALAIVVVYGAMARV